MEFLSEHNAMKFFGETNLDHVYKKDGVIESFKDVPMSITSENGSVIFNLQTRYLYSLYILACNRSLVNIDILKIFCHDDLFGRNAMHNKNSFIICEHNIG